MGDLEITECESYDEFARVWHTTVLDDHDVTLHEARERELISEDETRLLWQLLGQLAPDEVLVRIPAWLAEEKVGYVDGATPTAFVGQIIRETKQAIPLEETAAAQSLTKLAHRIHQLEQNSASADDDEWLADRLDHHRQQFDQREDVIELQDNWLPKSQLQAVLRR